MHLKIPKASDEAIISTFSDGVTDLKMKEELAMNDEMSTGLEMFNLAIKCAKAEEGCLSLLRPQAADAEEKKAKAKEEKRKALVVLAADPEAKHVRGGEPPSGGGRRASSMAPTAMIPPSLKSSAWSMPNTSTGSPDGSIEAPRVEEAAVWSAGTTVSRVRGGVNRLRRTAGVIALKRGNGTVSLMMLVLVKLGCPRSLRHPGGGMKAGRTTGLGASRSHGGGGVDRAHRAGASTRHLHERKNYHTKVIVFDVAHIHLPYNAILGYPALAKLMAVIHYGYNILKMPRSGGVITIAYDEKDAVCTLERAYRAAAAERSDDKEDELPREEEEELLPKERLGDSGHVRGDGDMLSIA
ncbi:hypothetical protein ZWY2020_048135 [Hordeum vulgare]|nr:hypothetical protein ZWY2020_048135 [Hordeum vulgare]